MNFFEVFTIAIFIFLSYPGSSEQQNCNIDLNLNPDDYPLFLSANNEILPIISRFRVSFIPVAEGETLRIACPGASNYISVLGRAERVANLTCFTDGRFRSIDGIPRNISEFSCIQTPYSELRMRSDNSSCDFGDVAYEVGFPLPLPINQFLTQYTICRTNSIRRTRHSRFIIRPDVKLTNVLRFDFRGEDDLLYRFSLRNLSSIQNLLPKYVFNNRTNFFARGHLVANAYFPFASQNKATFFYYNAAPQWQVFNAGHWFRVEDVVRDMTRNRNAEVFVGVHGQLTFERIDGSRVNVFLDMQRNVFPVPEFFWKYIDYRNGTTFFVAGINDIFLTQAEYQARSRSFCQVWPCPAANITTTAQVFCCQPNPTLLRTVGIV